MWSAGSLSRAHKLSIDSYVVEGMARDTDWTRVTAAKLTTFHEAPNI